MKRTRFFQLLLLLLAVAIDIPASAEVYIIWRELTKTNSDTGTPVAVSATSKPFRRATFYGRKAARTANTGTVYIGTNSTNDTQTVAITSGGSVVVESAPGYYMNLKDIYLDVATANDGVVVIYEY